MVTTDWPGNLSSGHTGWMRRLGGLFFCYYFFFLSFVQGAGGCKFRSERFWIPDCFFFFFLGGEGACAYRWFFMKGS